MATAVTISAAMMAGAVAGASPALAQTDTAQTEAEIVVESTISITVDADFQLTGASGTLADTTVEFTVTNNDGGFTVEVQPDAPNLLPPDPVENTDVIPFSDLEVFDIDDATFVPLDPGNPITIYTSDDPAPTGDTQQHDYQIEMPFVTPDSYTGTITYTATVTV